MQRPGRKLRPFAFARTHAHEATMAAQDLDVLIVDDHEGMRAMLRKMLERAGVGAVREAPSGADGLVLLAALDADLVLCDQTMPEMDGLSFLRAARAAGSQARAIVISGRDDAGFADMARAAGADAVLVKPVSPRDVLAAIERVLAR
jgi:DNA-binding NarL/FixJ family response regulator